jgi:transcriptional regulator with XRE-family HTH domain
LPKTITLGDYLRKKRLDLGLRQKDLAEILNSTNDAINYWENNLKKPSIRFLPKIVQFIGYCPYQPSLSIAQKLIIWRAFNGISQHRMAELIGVDPCTLAS